MLRMLTQGSDDLPRLLIAHGLFGSARNWSVIAKRLSDQFHVMTVDMRNHGDSPRAPTNSYMDMAADLAEVLEADGPAHVMGHSMGGKAAMVLALTRPELVTKLLVADIAPVGYTHSHAHFIDAMRRVDLGNIKTRGDADRQLAADVSEDGVRAFLLQSLDLKTKTWRLNLDILEAEMPEIIGFPDVTGSYDGPTFFLSGGASDYVLPDHRPLIKPLFPNARFAKLPGVGHWLHAENPRAFEASMRLFFNA
ncbi:MAG: alpha/beta fold hydrolase [Pseudomonadota bacterium]